MGKPTFLDNVRMFISGLAWDVFLWANRITNEQYWHQEGERIYLCNNSECGWVGWERDTVHFKHDADGRLCPECNETCENMTPSWVVELMEASNPMVHTQ